MKVEAINKCSFNFKKEKYKYVSITLKRDKNGKTFKEILEEIREKQDE